MADGDVLEDRPIANVTQGLQGAIPNLNITFDGGSPNATAQINVRGTYGTPMSSALEELTNVDIVSDDSGTYLFSVFRLKSAEA